MKKALLVVSHGTSFNETRAKTIGAIEEAVKKEYSDRIFFRAWTSDFIRRKVLARDGEKIDSTDEAMEKIIASGVRDVLVVSTHLLAGEEYEKITASILQYRDHFDRIAVAPPLLADWEHVSDFVRVITPYFTEVQPDQMVAFMGHGSEDEEATRIYHALNEEFRAQGYENFKVGTVNFEPGIQPVMNWINDRKPAKIFLTPLLIVCGSHANKDMAGEGPDSWANRMKDAGCEVDCILKGLGEYPAIRDLYVERARSCTSTNNTTT